MIQCHEHLTVKISKKYLLNRLKFYITYPNYHDTFINALTICFSCLSYPSHICTRENIDNLFYLVTVLDALVHHLARLIMKYVELVLLINPIFRVNENKKILLRCKKLDILYNLAIRLLDGRITTLLEARALTLFAADIHIKSASWGFVLYILILSNELIHFIQTY